MYLKRRTINMLLDLVNTVERQCVDTTLKDIRAFKDMKRRLVSYKIKQRLRYSKKYNRKHRTKMDRRRAKGAIQQHNY